MIYVQIMELNKYCIYFGLDGSVFVFDVVSGQVNGNFYFVVFYLDVGFGLKIGYWYKIVGYVMFVGFGNLVNWDDFGGIYDVGSGECVGGVNNFCWNDM